jgi:hypothetical protein
MGERMRCGVYSQEINVSLCPFVVEAVLFSARQ